MNKKRLLAIVLTLTMLLGVCTTSYAAPSDDQIITNREVKYYDDGTWLETVIYEPAVSVYGNTKTGTKTATYYSKNNEALWYVSVTGTFTYTGRNCLCTGARANSGSYVSEWKVSNTRSYYSGNTATGEATGKFYMDFILMYENTLIVDLSCDVDGNLS